MSLFTDYIDRGWSIIRVFGITPENTCQCNDPNRCSGPGKHPIDAWRKFQEKPAPKKLIENVWFKRDPLPNVGIVCGAVSGLVVIDEDAIGAANHLDLPPTLTATTHHGRRHFYFKHPGHTLPTSIRFAPNVDLKGDGGYVVAPPSRHASGETYAWVDFTVPLAPLPQRIIDLLDNADTSGPSQQSLQITLDHWDEDIVEGDRDVMLTKLAGSLLGRGETRETTLERIREHNQAHVIPPLPDSEILKIVNGIARDEEARKKQRATTEDSISLFRDGKPPTHLEGAAYRGLAGDILTSIDPYVEPCAAGILVGFLTAFGNKIGRNAYMTVSSQKHYTNLFTLVFGDSGTSRKGMSWSIVQDLMTPPPKTTLPHSGIVLDFSESSLAWTPTAGIASGEGLIFHVRDARPAEGKRPADPGVLDKRKLFYESEFGSVIRKAKPEGSILWQTLRNFFDTGSAENNPRHEPVKATDAHVSIVGNITPIELAESFPSAERTSGTANRFLWIFASPGKCLPEGKPIPISIMNSLKARVDEAVTFGKSVTEMTRDPDAIKYWAQLYTGELSEDETGPLHDLTSRGKPLILRLSMIYALLDHSKVIKKSHIESALAVWHYSKASIYYLYGNSAGTPLGNRILNYLETQPRKAATRSQISAAITGYQARELDSAVAQLRSTGQILEAKQPKPPGKPGPAAIEYRLATPK